jgi:urea carboxylase
MEELYDRGRIGPTLTFRPTPDFGTNRVHRLSSFVPRRRTDWHLLRDLLAGLEITISGPAIKFNTDVAFCLAGAPIKADLDSVDIPFWTIVQARAGQILRIGQITGGGARAYFLVQGGLEVPDYLGSKSTFALGRFGGHGGRVLRAGDVLRLSKNTKSNAPPILPDSPARRTLSPAIVPTYSSQWEIGVLYGPHGAPDFFERDYIDTFFAAEWKVHYNSNRTGVRLIGPKPNWTRKDGGEAGLHPSNIHDNAYGIGAIDFTGDMPILLGPDGPSLGGFVCPAVVVDAELWKLGQLKAGDTLRFRRLTVTEAETLKAAQEHEVTTLTPLTHRSAIATTFNSGSGDEAVLAILAADAEQPRVVYRASGDSYLLIEYGPLALDLNLRFRVHAMMQWLQRHHLAGIVDLTPGIRSLQVHFDTRKLHLKELLAILLTAEKELPPVSEMEVPTRIVHMPLSWEDESTLVAIRKYMQSVRADAPWCPSNLEFIRRVNGLENIDDVKKIVFDSSYLVLGLGDVYLGAPVAVPIDPRHRLVTTKYNPARTWTPENAVGIGGAYLCIYGMEGPGGYQFVGRTVQVWNRFGVTRNFERGKPWLLRFFDQIRFYPVSAEKLPRQREDFLAGKFSLRVEEETFRLRDYQAFLDRIAPEAAAFKARQQAAFEAERERWASTEFVAAEETESPVSQQEVELPHGASFIDAPVAGNLWKLMVIAGDRVEPNKPLAIIESMKMEMQVSGTRSGMVHSVLCKESTPVSQGQHLFIVTGD